ncbi:DUF6809 family protein [Anaerofustis sp.]|uniref:DUF6809 family protein n=1 Tax=Anaerofustis sp. TaxID=1872517 RepID=UPI0025C631AF|nr:DUF6809 family protein [Anaerofustis sp.]
MNNLLIDLYEGNINPSEYIDTIIDEYEVELREKTILEEKFCSKLDENMQNEFYNILERWIKVYPMELRNSFIEGYKLGCRMTNEIYK